MLALRSRPTRNHDPLTLGVAVVLGSMLATGTAYAEPKINILRQLTHVTAGDIKSPRLRMQDAGAIAFESDADVLGPGTATSQTEIYLWTEASGGMTVCLTCGCPNGNGPGSVSYDATRPTDNVNAGGRPDMVVFVSTADFAPTAEYDNADGNSEIFIAEINQPCKFHQLTNTVAPVVNAEPFASDNGRCIVFSSNGDFAVPDSERTDPQIQPDNGFRNPDGSREVFMYSKLNGTEDYPFTGYFAQMSNGPAGTTSDRPVIGGYWWTRQCQVSAYQSDVDQLPNDDEPVSGSHIFLYRRTNGEVERFFAPREIPHGFPAGDYRNPFISAASPFARGPHVVFEAEPDLWNNGSTGNDVFRYRIFHPHMTQYSNVGSTGEVKRPVVSDGGGVIVFDSTSSHVARARRGSQPGNDDGNTEIYRLKGRRKVWQVTKTVGCANTHASVKDDGRAIVFRSTCDLITGRNPNGLPQIFIWQLARKSSRQGPNQLLADCPADPDCLTSNDGSLAEIRGKQRRPPRANCLDTGRC